MILAVESGALEPAPCSGLGLWWQPTKVENTVKTNGIEVPVLESHRFRTMASSRLENRKDRKERWGNGKSEEPLLEPFQTKISLVCKSA